MSDIGADRRGSRVKWGLPLWFAPTSTGNAVVVLMTDGFVVLPPLPPAEGAAPRPSRLSLWSCRGGRRGS